MPKPKKPPVPKKIRAVQRVAAWFDQEAAAARKGKDLEMPPEIESIIRNALKHDPEVVAMWKAIDRLRKNPDDVARAVFKQASSRLARGSTHGRRIPTSLRREPKTTLPSGKKYQKGGAIKRKPSTVRKVRKGGVLLFGMKK